MFLLELLEKQRFGAPCSFDSTDNFMMAFVGAMLDIPNGKEKQSISLWEEEAAFGSLDLSGCTALVYDGEFYGSEIRGIEHVSDSSEIVSHCTRNIVTGTGSLAGDLYIDGELSFEEGASLTLESDFYHDGALKMGGGSLKVKGHYSVESSVVDVTDGRLTVDGDMDVKSDASLSLRTPESRLHVRGDLNISSTKTSSNKMADGVIEVGGD